MQHTIASSYQTMKTTLDVAAPVTAAAWLVDLAPTFAAILAGVWALIQIVHFFATGRYKEWIVFKNKKPRGK